jgi:H3 lysine-79-specific histone-lysine N-methyltransferase
MMIEDKTEARRVLRRLYKDVWAYTVPKKDDLRIRKARSSSLYGEITFASLNKLLEYLDLGEKDVFFDLGSGVGKVVLQVAMTSPVKKATGVELAATRYKESMKVLDAAAKEKSVSRRKCEFRNENILETDLSKATVIYTCSTAFPMTFMKRLTKKLAEIKKPLRIVTTQELPKNSGLELVDKLHLDMSWARKTVVYVFANKHAKLV